MSFRQGTERIEDHLRPEHRSGKVRDGDTSVTEEKREIFQQRRRDNVSMDGIVNRGWAYYVLLEEQRIRN